MGGCLSCGSNDDDAPLKDEGVTELKNKKRWCTDFLFLILIIAAWVAMTIVGFIACGVINDPRLPKGNPKKLVYPMDYLGNVCGVDTAVIDRSYGYYFPDGQVVCVKNCPSKDNYEQFICHYDLQSSVNSNYLLGYNYVLQFKCMYYVQSYAYLNRCYPLGNVNQILTQATAANSTLSKSSPYSVSSGEGWFNKFITDLLYLRGYIFGIGIGGAVLFSFVYLYLLRIPGMLFIVVWSIIFSIMASLVTGAWLLWGLANTWKGDGQHSQVEITTMYVFAYFTMGLSVIYILIIIVLRSRIGLAIGIVKQTARILSSMPLILLVPVIQTIGLVAFLAVWFIYILYLASSGEMTTVSSTYEFNGVAVPYSYRVFTYTTNTKYAFLYMLFCWYWTSEFVVAFGQLVTALTFATYYFTRDKSTVGNVTVFNSFALVSVYHMGTAAFGSLVIAIIKTIRAVLNYIATKAKQSGNYVLMYIMCIFNCCLWCLEKCLKFLNKHAYIITAIYAYSFCHSCRKAFYLLLRNVLRVSAVNLVSSLILFLGKIFTPVVTTFICYLLVAYTSSKTETYGLIAPLVVCFIIAWWISSIFSELFGMGIETILFCYIADEEMFKIEDRFVEGELLGVFQKTHQAYQASLSDNKIHQDVSSSKEEVQQFKPPDNSQKAQGVLL